MSQATCSVQFRQCRQAGTFSGIDGNILGSMGAGGGLAMGARCSRR